MQPSPTGRRITRSAVRVCPVLSVKSKTENDTAFKLRREVTRAKILAEQFWGQKVKGQGHWGRKSSTVLVDHWGRAYS